MTKFTRLYNGYSIDFMTRRIYDSLSNDRTQTIGLKR